MFISSQNSITSAREIYRLLHIGSNKVVIRLKCEIDKVHLKFL